MILASLAIALSLATVVPEDPAAVEIRNRHAALSKALTPEAREKVSALARTLGPSIVDDTVESAVNESVAKWFPDSDPAAAALAVLLEAAVLAEADVRLANDEQQKFVLGPESEKTASANTKPIAVGRESPFLRLPYGEWSDSKDSERILEFGEWSELAARKIQEAMERLRQLFERISELLKRASSDENGIAENIR